MPVDGESTDGPRGGDAVRSARTADAGHSEPPVPQMSDDELVKDYSVLKTVGTEQELAVEALKVLNTSLDTGKMSLAGRDLSDDQVMKVLKAIGIYSKLKNLCPARTSVLPVKEFDLSGNGLVIFTPHAITGIPEVSQRSLQPLQLVVQFVRVSTDAKVVRLDDCNLQGTTHDKDDKIEQEVIRLVKKFGAGKEARYAREVSLVGNKFEAEFAKKVIEAAYWERIRHPDKDNPPKLFLDLRRNRIRSADKLLDELRAGQNAGGSISVACSTDPEGERNKALIVVDLGDQVMRSVTPLSKSRAVAPERAARPPQPRAVSRSPPPREKSAPPPKRYTRSPSAPRRRPGGALSASPARGGAGGGGGGRRDERSPPPRDDKRDEGRSRDDRGGDRRDDGGGRGRAGGGAKRPREDDRRRGGARRCDDDYDYDDYDYDDYDYSRSPTPKRRVRRRKTRGGGGGRRAQKRTRGGGGGGGRRGRSDSRTPPRERGGGRRRRR